MNTLVLSNPCGFLIPQNPMKSSSVRSFIARLLTLSLVSLAAFGLASCGSGHGGEDGPATVRPKTMDGIILKLGNNSAQMEFIRNSSSSAVINSGDEETGTFIYTSFVGVTNLRYYDNVAGSQSNLLWPQTVAIASYKYRAINESSGVLTLTGTGSIQNIVYTAGNGFIYNDSLVVPFVRGSYNDALPLPSLGYDLTKVVQIDLTFSSNGTYASSDTVTLSLPESTMVNTFDTVRIPSTVSLAAGGAVPLNYNPVIDPLRPSLIAPASLSDRLMTAKNGIPDPTKDFSIQFVADATQPNGSGSGSQPDEVGHGLLRVAGSAVDVALDYTWRRIAGTDSGELVLSNIPDDVLLPFDNSLNGTYTLNFLGTENGTYAGAVDADTLNAADVSGSFIMLNGN